ncbi:Alg9-like mannosyltransferase-like protein 1 [Elsinoe fawcettii]|nr:Alg9-like mannosyltransferase-like protein 1 [Elsinoe fawcettii]
MTSVRKERSSKDRPWIRSEDGSRVLYFLVAFRLVNALSIRTFFQPDEYYQSLEPAWKIAFGDDSGAWITWEWREYLRSSIHPYLFSYTFKVASWLSTAFALEARMHGELLLVAPKVLQAVLAALMDFYTWKLSTKYFGDADQIYFATLLASIFSPWQWFCSTRTLVNSLEGTVTAAALYFWPWDLFTGVSSLRHRAPANRSLLLSLTLAALACVLRPPNVIIWLVVGGCCVAYRLWLWQRAFSVLSRVMGYATIAGFYVLMVSATLDWNFYKRAVFPPYRFLQFNVVQSLAVFYGRNRSDYYFTEGLPLLLTAFLPFAIYGVVSAIQLIFVLKYAGGSRTVVIRDFTLTMAVIVTVGALTTIPHKEVRFLYPLLPILNLLAAPAFAAFFRPVPSPAKTYRKVLFWSLIIFNTAFALYVSLVHQRGVIDVTHYLRRSHEKLHLMYRSAGRQLCDQTDSQAGSGITTAAFLMPCHSIPWRSHLIHPGLKAWALTCEPPLGLTIEQRTTYLDEADQFYANPTGWMRSHMAPLSTLPSPFHDLADAEKRLIELGSAGLGIPQSGSAPLHPKAASDRKTSQTQTLATQEGKGDRNWPMFLVFFQHLEPVVKVYPGLSQGGYRECWRGFNSHFHDDWRRKGDVVVWCLESVHAVLESEVARQ